WIETTGLDKSKYITIDATVPKYDISNDKEWKLKPNETRKVQLAMVGMHVVGSVADHPEMIWATFEHVNNTRSAEYKYELEGGGTATEHMNAGGTWLFSSSVVGGPTNRRRMLLVASGNIKSTDDQTTIGPSNILRNNPWGSSAADMEEAIRKNTEVIAINKSVLGMLADGDVRKNYIMVGSTWISGGVDA